MARRAALAAFLMSLVLPALALAAPFGGQVSQVTYCTNGVILTQVGGKLGGTFLWDPGSTVTYPFGPPSRSGQWVLGLSGAPYYCLISVLPLITSPGILMSVLGSSK